ncbi:MAG: hypothetical protein LBP61_02285 [Desulfovibrio sp.]|jgi:hypothetical protein|nr:hypothetical protein [Desulfovibrio sp.]
MNMPPDMGELSIHFATARYIPGKWDPPSLPPPYSSILDDVRHQMELFRRIDAVRQNALHPVRLQAGQHSPVNGREGRFALPAKDRLSVLGADLGSAPARWSIPEAQEGALFAVSV